MEYYKIFKQKERKKKIQKNKNIVERIDELEKQEKQNNIAVKEMTIQPNVHVKDSVVDIMERKLNLTLNAIEVTATNKTIKITSKNERKNSQ